MQGRGCLGLVVVLGTAGGSGAGAGGIKKNGGGRKVARKPPQCCWQQHRTGEANRGKGLVAGASPGASPSGYWRCWWLA